MNARVEPRPGLRRMLPADVGRVMDVETAAYAFPWTRGIFLDCLRVGYACWVLELEGDLIGHAVLTMAANEAHLLNLTIGVEHQRRGFGRFLLREVIDQARRSGVEALFLEVRPSNRAARHLYRSEGFAHIGTRPRYYPGATEREDAWVLSIGL